MGIDKKYNIKRGIFIFKNGIGINIKDLTGGFNLWKKEVLLSIDLDSIISKGYSFQIELKYKAKKKGFKIVEFPIIFEDRTKGKSKMSKKIFFEALKNVWKIREYR